MAISAINNYLAILVLALAGLFIVLLVWLIILQLNLNRMKKIKEVFFAGRDAQSLENVILEQAKNLQMLDKEIQELYNISNQLNILALRGLRKTGLVRFNPFKDIGGNQSFSIAFLNGKNNGVTISSLYTREGTRIYAKAIKSGISEVHPLTQEEEQAIKIALASEPKKVT